MKNNNIDDYVEDDIDISVLIRALLEGKWIIAVITGLASIFVVWYSLSLPNIYTGKALLVPVSAQDSVSSSVQELSGLASLAGISISDSADTSAVALEKINTLSFFEEKILPQISLPNLVAVESWDPKSNTITYDQSVYDSSNQIWVREVEFPKTPKPSPQESFRSFVDHLSVYKDPKTGFISISIDHQSPFIAKKWADLVVDEINSYFREKDRLAANFAVNYLNNEIYNTRLSEVKEVIAAVLAQQIQQLTLIEANINYVFDYIDPPVVMEKKSSPRRAMICIIGALLGGFIGALIALIRFFKPLNLDK
tara:strand:+ start:12638 stop:13567 length:930 start_codon:yes stop_codon:yes gene_type:complete